MPRGSAPGEHRGGRKPGTRNRETLERLAEAEADVRRAKADGRQLAKDVLEEFMLMFKDMAERHAPSGRAQGAKPDEIRFEKYARLAIQCAQTLAPYQSPTFKAIMVTPPPEKDEPVRAITLRIFDHDGREISNRDDKEIDPIEAMRTYRKIVAASSAR